MERPERRVLVILGALFNFNRMAPVLWVIAVLSTITVIHRMRYTWTRTQDLPRRATPRRSNSTFHLVILSEVSRAQSARLTQSKSPYSANIADADLRNSHQCR
jgi:hypothetical protein